MNIFDFFDEYDIPYWTEGNNVGKGWVNVQCCYCPDDSNHLGIHLTTGATSCWKCGNHHLLNTLMHLTGCTYNEAKEVNLSRAAGTPPLKGKTKTSSALQMSLPRESKFSFTKAHRDYLRDKGFPPLKTIREWRLKAVGNVANSRYKWRIIIPIYLDKKLVSFTSRAISDKVKSKYIAANPDECILTTKNVIYNLDSVPEGGNAIAVEGPTDVWKFGSGTIGLMGTKFTTRQLILIKRKKIKRLFILMDKDRPGKKASRGVSKQIAPVVRSCEIVTLNKHSDPGQMTFLEASIVKYDLGINY